MLWLKLNVDSGIDLHFRVRGSNQPDQGNYDDWCLIDLAVKSSQLNYGLYDDEALEVRAGASHVNGHVWRMWL